jgi:hypothetical protein
MSAHLTPEQFVEYADGTLPPATEALVAAHLEECGTCRASLAELSEFDGFVQSHHLGDDLLTAAMFEVSERVLAGPALAGPSSWRTWRVLVLVAAALLVAPLALWTFSGGGADDLGVRITRYLPEGALRSAPPERFHLDLDLADAAYVAVFAKFRDGKVAQLAPGGALTMSPRGPLRVPANELLDWEYPPDRMPTQVLVVAFAVEPAATVLAEVRAAWAASASIELPGAAISPGRRAQLLPFPAR